MGHLIIKVNRVGEWTDEDVRRESGTESDVNPEPEDIAGLETTNDPDGTYDDIVKILSKARTYTVSTEISYLLQICLYNDIRQINERMRALHI